MDFDTLDMARLRGLAGNKWRRYGDEVLPAWVADMDFLQAAPIRDYVARAGTTGNLGYPFSESQEDLKAIFAERAKEVKDFITNKMKFDLNNIGDKIKEIDALGSDLDGVQGDRKSVV